MRDRLAGVLFAFAVLASPPTRADGGTPEEGALAEAGALQGPLALSADGHWRVHVDAHNVLHRVNLDDPTRQQALALPARVRLLAASRSGQKVALLIEPACIGRADFGSGPGAPARLEWRPTSGKTGSALPWQAEIPAGCRERAQAWSAPDVVAISSDGRLVANASEVFDVDAHRVVATLPRGQEHPLLMRFVDADRRLLVVSAFLGRERDGPDNAPSQLQIATWDLATQALWSLTLRDLREGGGLPSLLPAYAARRGDIVTSTMGPYRELGWMPGALEVSHLATCNAATQARPPIGDWTSVAIDPAGRWVAGTRTIPADPADPEYKAGLTSELIVQELASGRRLARQAWNHDLHGLIANADGSALFALVAPSPWRWNDDQVRASGPPSRLGELVEFKIPAQAAAAAATTAWPASPCPIGGEAPGAREGGHASQVFKPRWSIPVHRFVEPRANADIPAWMPHDADLACRGSCGDIFKRTDSSLWVDDGPTITQLMPTTGQRLRTLPTPRTDKLSSVILAASGGYFNAQGDTLTWRPFDASTDNAFRQVVDRRPGWQIILLQRQGDTMLAAWVRKPPMARPIDAPFEPRPATYVVYNAQAHILHASEGTEDADGDSWPTSLNLQHAVQLRNLAPCHDETGALAEGHDWRIGPFGSVIAWSCGPTPGAARIASWSGSDMSPQPPAIDYGVRFDRVVAADDTLGVTQNVQQWRHLRVFDARQRRELGAIDTPPDDDIVDIVADDGNGLVFVETTDHEHRGLRHILAYAVR